MNINLETGKITAYQFYLEAGTGNNKIYLNSEATTHPLQIGSNFKVSWDGVMTSALHLENGILVEICYIIVMEDILVLQEQSLLFTVQVEYLL